jgi:hypothetical protein
MWRSVCRGPDSAASECSTQHFYERYIRVQMLSITFEPENRLVARGLETEWENRLRDLATAEMELRRREHNAPARSAPSNSKRSSGWAAIFVESGTRKPPLIAIAKSYCARYYRRWSSISSGPKVVHT